MESNLVVGGGISAEESEIETEAAIKNAAEDGQQPLGEVRPCSRIALSASCPGHDP